MSNNYNRKVNSETKNKYDYSNSIGEPNIINKAMIMDAYLSTEANDEESRLHRMESINYKNITILDLNNKKILRIDHLWMLRNLTKLSLNYNKIEFIENLDMLSNLKELDLSFNYIKKIHNLHNLTNLEVLTLFNNLITRIENLDKLEKLIILSIGNNMIKSNNDINHLRCLKQLKVLNLEGNPVCKEMNIAVYVAAILPNVLYYNYNYIKDDDREKAKIHFAREIRCIENNEEIELKKRIELDKNVRNGMTFSANFVEHLNRNQLFESMWFDADEYNQTFSLLEIVDKNIIEEYQRNISITTQQIYKAGLDCADERQKHFQEFWNTLEEDHSEWQEKSRELYEEFIEFKSNISEEMSKHKDDYVSLKKFIDIFDERLNKVWQNLMHRELHLHEATEELIVKFEYNMKKMIKDFLDETEIHFSQLRDLSIQFSKNSYEAFALHVASLLSQSLKDVKNNTIQPEFEEFLEDEDRIKRFIDKLNKFHVQKIDEYEDHVILQSKDYLVNMISKLKRNEVKRNRANIMDISTVLDTNTEDLQHFFTHMK